MPPGLASNTVKGTNLHPSHILCVPLSNSHSTFRFNDLILCYDPQLRSSIPQALRQQNFLHVPCRHHLLTPPAGSFVRPQVSRHQNHTMHNTLTRLQNTFGFFTTLAFVLAASISVLTLLPYPPLPTSSHPSASISVRNVQVVKGRPHYYSAKKEEYAHIKFDLDADLSGLFTWNTKQVFVYVVVRYPGPGGLGAGGGLGEVGEMSESVIWDSIISAPASPWTWGNMRERYWSPTQKLKASSSSKSKKGSTTTNTKDIVKPGLLSLKNQKPKYQITDPSGILSEKSNATLQVRWNVQPWVGALVWDGGMLGNRVGPWEAGKVGRSEMFDFPPLKGSRTDVVKDREGTRTPKPAEATPVVG